MFRGNTSYSTHSLWTICHLTNACVGKIPFTTCRLCHVIREIQTNSGITFSSSFSPRVCLHRSVLLAKQIFKTVVSRALFNATLCHYCIMLENVFQSPASPLSHTLRKGNKDVIYLLFLFQLFLLPIVTHSCIANIKKNCQYIANSKTQTQLLVCQHVHQNVSREFSQVMDKVVFIIFADISGSFKLLTEKTPTKIKQNTMNYVLILNARGSLIRTQIR